MLHLRSFRLGLFCVFCVFLAVRAAPRLSLHDTASAFTFHDTQYSEDEVLLNPHVFPDARDGDVMEFYTKGAPSERRVALKVLARVCVCVFFLSGVGENNVKKVHLYSSSMYFESWMLFPPPTSVGPQFFVRF